MENKRTNFDFREIFKRECGKELDAIEKVCSIFGIPYFFEAALYNNAEEGRTKYLISSKMPESAELHLENDMLRKHLMVESGFDIVPKASLLPKGIEEAKPAISSRQEKEEDLLTKDDTDTSDISGLLEGMVEETMDIDGDGDS